jgi:hypothetical protein
MGFAGYVAVCVQLADRTDSSTKQTTRKGKQTNTHAVNNKINEEKQNRKAQMETCKV